MSQSRQDLVKLVRKWGYTNTGGLLEENTHAYSCNGIEGFIGYHLKNSNAVVFGDPVCAPENKAALALAFQKECESKKIDVVYAMASLDFAKWAVDNLSAIALEWGENYLCDPRENPIDKTGVKASLVRRKSKHALKEGVVVKEYHPIDPNIETQIENLGRQWLEKRKGVQIHLSHLNLFKDQEGKRWFYAQQGDKIVGLGMLNALESRQGWLLNHVMISPDAAHGVPELLIVKMLETVDLEGCHCIVMGPAPCVRLKEILGANAFLAWTARLLYAGANLILHFGRHGMFWKKFQLETKGTYLVFPRQNLSYKSIRSLLNAFNLSAS